MFRDHLARLAFCNISSESFLGQKSTNFYFRNVITACIFAKFGFIYLKKRHLTYWNSQIWLNDLWIQSQLSSGSHISKISLFWTKKYLLFDTLFNFTISIDFITVSSWPVMASIGLQLLNIDWYQLIANKKMKFKFFFIKLKILILKNDLNSPRNMIF